MSQIPHILCIDVESNGLDGEAFCVGAVLLDVEGRVRHTFLARCPLRDPVPYVREHVLQALADVPETNPDFGSMATAFAIWLRAQRAVRPDALVVADCAWPVDTRFLHAVIDRDGEHPPWAPYPLHEVATLLLACGLDPTEGGAELASTTRVAAALGDMRVVPHHPVYDATRSALVARACLRRLAAAWGVP